MRRALLVAVGALLSCSLIESLDDLRASDAGGDVAPVEAGCGDTTSSPGNCGACGHDCLGGECKASACQPVALAPIQPAPSALAVENASLYWIASSEIHRAPTSLDAGTWSRVGSTSVPGVFELAAASPTIHAITTAGSFESVTVAENDPPDGAAPAAVPYANPITNVSSWVFDSGHQYLYSHSGSCKGSSGWCVISYDDPTVSPKRFADNLVASGLLAVAGGRVYFASGTTIGSFVYTDASGTSTTVATTSDAPTSIAADANGIYVTSTTLGSVLVASPAGDGGAPAPLASAQVNPRAVAAQAGLVAWAADDGLWACDPKSCKPTNYVTQAAVSSIAIDAAAIYWTDPNRAGVYKIAR